MTVTTDAPSRPPAAPPRAPAWASLLTGAVAAAVALGTSELLAGLIGPAPSLVLSVGNGVVELGAGTPVKDVAIALFGTGEKTALVIGTVVLALVFGAVLGWVADRVSVVAAGAGLVAFGLLGVVSTLASPLDSTAWAVVIAAAAVAAGVAVLVRLQARTARLHLGGASTAGPGEGAAGARREFLRIALGLAAVGGVVGVLGRTLNGRSRVASVRSTVTLPPAATAPEVPEAVSFEGIDGLTPFFTPNEDFYRIDTALMAPSVDVATWSLRVHGMVDTEVSLTYDDLLALEQFEADVTIACVSNEVGGDLIGTARWQGVRLADVLAMAGVQDGADQVVGRAVDGWTAGFPTEVALDGRDAMIAVAMNGEPLPVEHGFPARLIVPGLYGYVSATKWLQDIELTTWEAFDGYWVPRGWAKEGPVKTQSRIDVPRRGADVQPGRVVIAGVAWAQHRGVARVEVQIDDGPWQAAELADELNVDTWRQWRLEWDAAEGDHLIRVRATDADGMTQSEAPVPVAPDGAEGYHARSIRVA